MLMYCNFIYDFALDDSQVYPRLQICLLETTEDNFNCFRKYKKQDYTDKEPMLDGRMDELILHVNTGSSDEEEEQEEEEENFDDGEVQSEFEMSDVDFGITPQ
jgi:hypothetical protein